MLCRQFVLVLPKVRRSHVVVEYGVVGVQRQGFLVVLDSGVVVLLPLLHVAAVVVTFRGLLVLFNGSIEALGRLGIFLQEQVRHAFFVPQQGSGVLGNCRGVEVEGIEIALLRPQRVALFFQIHGGSAAIGNWRRCVHLLVVAGQEAQRERKQKNHEQRQRPWRRETSHSRTSRVPYGSILDLFWDWIVPFL